MTYINLLPFDYVRRQLIRRRLVQWAVVWSLVLSGMLAIAWVDHVEYTTMSGRLATLQKDYEPIKQLSTQSRALRAQLNDVRRREAIMLRLAVRRPVLTILGAISDAARKSDGQVSVTTLAISTPSQGTRYDENHPSIVGIEGLAENDAAISRFASVLRRHDMFRRVSLKNTGDHEVAGIKVRSYGINCEY